MRGLCWFQPLRHAVNSWDGYSKCPLKARNNDSPAAGDWKTYSNAGIHLLVVLSEHGPHCLFSLFSIWTCIMVFGFYPPSVSWTYTTSTSISRMITAGMLTANLTVAFLMNSKEIREIRLRSGGLYGVLVIFGQNVVIWKKVSYGSYMSNIHVLIIIGKLRNLQRTLSLPTLVCFS